MLRVIILVVVICSSYGAFAGGRGGHNTTFDLNASGGGWTTLTCNGSGSDLTGLRTWISNSTAANPALAKLRIVGDCVWPDGTSLAFDNSLPTNDGIRNALIWGYGASISGATIGGFGLYGDDAHFAFIQNASPGDTTVTLVTAADASIFAVGSSILVDGLSTQDNGDPPNWQFNEFHLITAITGTTTKVVSLDGPLVNSYLTTWPNNGGHLAGPAAIHLLLPSWNTNLSVYGLDIKQQSSVGGSGRVIGLWDVTFDGIGYSASVAQNVFEFFGYGGHPEFDKEVTNLYAYRTGFYQPFFESSSITNVTFTSITVAGPMNGSPLNLTMKNSSIAGLWTVGPTTNGHGKSVALDGTFIGSANNAGNRVLISDLAFSGGSFTTSNGTIRAQAISIFVPGQKYFFGDGSERDNSLPHTVFTVTSISEPGGILTIATDLGGTLPTPNCGIPACTTLVPYPAATVTQTNSPAGSADITQFAAP